MTIIENITTISFHNKLKNVSTSNFNNGGDINFNQNYNDLISSNNGSINFQNDFEKKINYNKTTSLWGSIVKKVKQLSK